MAVAIPFIAEALAPEALAGAAAAFGGEAITWGTSAGMAAEYATGLAGVGTAASYLGTGIQALGALQKGQASSQAAKYNSQLAERNAQIADQNESWAIQEGEQNTEQKEMQTRATVGSIRSAQSANGIDVNSGSNLDVQSSAARLGELDALNIRADAARKAYGYATDSANQKAKSNLDKYESDQDALGGYIDAGSTFLTGSTNAGLGYQKYLTNNTSLLMG